MRKLSKQTAQIGKVVVIVSAAAGPGLLASQVGGNTIQNPIANPSQYVYQYTGFNLQTGQLDTNIVVRNITLVIAALIGAKLFSFLTRVA